MRSAASTGPIYLAVRDAAALRAALTARSYARGYRGAAAAIGCSSSYLHQLATGDTRRLSVARAAAIEAALGARPGEFFGLEIGDADLLRPYLEAPAAAAA